MLWVGWFGFNAGSAVAADGSAGMAMLATHISAATGALTWMAIEWIKSGKATMIGIATGMVAGLATITPASGSVGPAGGLLIGFLAGLVCFYATQAVKSYFKIDDSLDVFPVHGVGGILGIIMIAFVGNPNGFLGSGAAGISEDGTIAQLMIQLQGVVVISAYTAMIIPEYDTCLSGVCFLGGSQYGVFLGGLRVWDVVLATLPDYQPCFTSFEAHHMLQMDEGGVEQIVESRARY